MSQSTRYATIAAAALFAVSGLTFGPVVLGHAPAAAQVELPNGASGRVHYDHRRDRGRDRDRRGGRDRDRDGGGGQQAGRGDLPNGANGRVHYDHRRDRGGRRGDRRPERGGDVRIVIEDDRAGTSSTGSYVGGVSGFRDPGNGSYFYVERDDYYAGGSQGGVPAAPSGPKVIDLGAGGAGGGCSHESGVCVIRPGQ